MTEKQKEAYLLVLTWMSSAALGAYFIYFGWYDYLNSTELAACRTAYDNGYKSNSTIETIKAGCSDGRLIDNSIYFVQNINRLPIISYYSLATIGFNALMLLPILFIAKQFSLLKRPLLKTSLPISLGLLTVATVAAWTMRNYFEACFNLVDRSECIISLPDVIAPIVNTTTTQLLPTIPHPTLPSPTKPPFDFIPDIVEALRIAGKVAEILGIVQLPCGAVLTGVPLLTAFGHYLRKEKSALTRVATMESGTSEAPLMNNLDETATNTPHLTLTPATPVSSETTTPSYTPLRVLSPATPAPTPDIPEPVELPRIMSLNSVPAAEHPRPGHTRRQTSRY
jgi:hypothetical protein